MKNITCFKFSEVNLILKTSYFVYYKFKLHVFKKIYLKKKDYRQHQQENLCQRQQVFKTINKGFISYVHLFF